MRRLNPYTLELQTSLVSFSCWVYMQTTSWLFSACLPARLPACPPACPHARMPACLPVIKIEHNFRIFLYCSSFLLMLSMQTIENAIFDDFKGNNSALNQ